MSTRAARWPSIALVILVSVLSLAACGSDSTGPGAAASDAASEPARGAPSSPGAQPAPAAQAAQAPAHVTPAKSGPQPSRAQADALSVAELAQRRDLWPSRVAFVKEARLDATTGWRPGDELPLSDWQGSNVILDEGSFLFDMPVESTDAVERTRDRAAALSPEALALTVEALQSRPELWPQRLQVAVRLEFGDRSVVPAGREVSLRFFEGFQLAVYDREVANYYTVAPNETDVMARARERLELPEAERAPFFIRSLEASLDAGAGQASLGDADYVLVYSGRLGCMRCADFAPRLEQFYERTQASAPAGSRFELVFLSNDADATSAGKYRAQAGLPGGVIAFERRLEAANLMALPLRTLPGLFVFDRQGNLVDRNHPDAGSPSADEVLAKFEARLTQTAGGAAGGAAR
jgi:hypothetical protein